MSEELICPITHMLLEDPVQLPCCGRAISREPLLKWLENKPVCPLCV